MAIRSRPRALTFVAALVAFSALLVPSGLSRTYEDAPGFELIGAFGGDIPITGAVAKGDYLFVTSAHRVSIFDISSPVTPTLVGSTVSPNPIHGELLPTNGEILLLNDGLGGATMDVWNVEDRANPVPIATVESVKDEHWGCVNSCTWAYGSEGTVVDLRDPSRPVKTEVDWKERAGISADVDIHRVDEYRPGYLATGSHSDAPVAINARAPLRPRRVARATLPDARPAGIIYSSWPLGGRSRYLLASVERQESQDCDYKAAGTLLSFDTNAYPGRTRLPFAGRLQSPSSDCRGTGFYFHPSPNYQEDGLVVHAYFEGVRVVRVGARGRLTEVDTFEPPGLGLVWHAFWAAEDIVYAVNQTGEVYILRFT